MNKIEEALDTIKSKDETWADVFARINKTRGVDIKTLTKVVICILEELDVTNDRGNKKGTERGSLIFSTDLGTTNNDVQKGTTGTENEVPVGI